MSLMALHAPMDMINNYAYACAHSKEISVSTVSVLRQWQQDEDCDISCWHAKEIRRLTCQRTDEGRKYQTETPHDALCLFLASVAGWCSEIVSGDRHGLARSILEEGIEGLGLYRVRVKGFLSTILESLLQKTEEEQGSPATPQRNRAVSNINHPDFWLGVRNPGVEDAVQDQESFDPSFLESIKIKSSLQATPDYTNFFAEATSITTANQLQNPDYRV